MSDSPNPTHQNAGHPSSEIRLKKPLPEVTRIIGEDGELVFEVPGPRKRHPRESSGLTTTRLLLLLVVIVWGAWHWGFIC